MGSWFSAPIDIQITNNNTLPLSTALPRVRGTSTQQKKKILFFPPALPRVGITWSKIITPNNKIKKTQSLLKRNFSEYLALAKTRCKNNFNQQQNAKDYYLVLKDVCGFDKVIVLIILKKNWNCMC